MFIYISAEVQCAATRVYRSEIIQKYKYKQQTRRLHVKINVVKTRVHLRTLLL